MRRGFTGTAGDLDPQAVFCKNHPANPPFANKKAGNDNRKTKTHHVVTTHLLNPFLGMDPSNDLIGNADTYDWFIYGKYYANRKNEKIFMKIKSIFIWLLILLFVLFSSLILVMQGQNNAGNNLDVNESDEKEGELIIMQKYESIKYKLWKLEKWHLATVVDTYARPYTFLRITPLSQEINEPPTVSAVFRGFPVGKDEFYTNTINNLELVECSKKERRREAWFGGSGGIYSFPPDRLCWEVEINDPFNGLERFSYKDLYDTGGFYLEIEVIIDKNEKVHFNKSFFEFIGFHSQKVPVHHNKS